jgi:NodT family efflux transporter outer membrane factor (OMF) lipoprotein
MPLRQISRRAAALALAAAVSYALHGCAVGPDYRTPKIKMPDSFAAQAAQAPSSPATVSKAVDATRWWKSLGDDELSSLIDRAIKANPQLEIALARVQEAREQEVVMLGYALPEVEASGGAAKGTGSDLARGRADQTLISAENGAGFNKVTQVYGFAAGWEIDLFGQYRREFQAARADAQAAEAARNNVLISIVADVARAYVDMRGLQMQLAVLQKNVDVAQHYVDYVTSRNNLGITNGLDVTLANRQLSTLKAQLAPLNSQIDSAQYIIAIYCGAFPESMVKELSSPGQVPQVPEKLDTGVPLDLLRHRPDINEAERQLAGATARVGVATANLFPHLAITGAAGYQGQGLGVSPSLKSFIWSAGPAASIPILDFGALDALVNIADYNTHALLMNYKQMVLGAVSEVDSASSAYVAQQDRLNNLKSALDASQESVSLATQRFDRGLIDSLNVIDAQRQEFVLEQEYVAAQQAAADQFIGLYKALGSGWEDYQTLPKIRRPLPAVIAALVRSATPNSAKSDDVAQGMPPE